MLTSIRERGAQLATSAAIGIAALALSAAITAPALAEEPAEQQPYDLEATAVLVRDAADPSTAYVHATTANRGDSVVKEAVVATGAWYSSGTNIKLISAEADGDCAPIPDSPEVVTACNVGDLAPGEYATAVFKIKIDADADLNIGRIGTVAKVDITQPGSDTNVGNNTAIFAAGKSIKQPPSLAGHVWNDKNADGLQTAGEPGVSDVPVMLHRDGVPVYAGKTNKDGDYRIETIWTGNYTITIKAPEGYKNGPAGVGKDEALNSDVNPDGTRELECVEESTEPQLKDLGPKVLSDASNVAKGQPVPEVPTFCDYDVDAALIALPPVVTTPAPGKGGGELAVTGTQVGAIAGAGALLLAGGAAAVFAMRRRRPSEDAA